MNKCERLFKKFLNFQSGNLYELNFNQDSHQSKSRYKSSSNSFRNYFNYSLMHRRGINTNTFSIEIPIDDKPRKQFFFDKKEATE